MAGTPADAHLPRPDATWLWQSLLATLLLPPVGAVGLVYALRARAARAAGDPAAARAHAGRARSLALSAIGGAVFLLFLWLGLVAGGGA